MKVFSLLGFVDYEGSDLVGVFSSKEKLMEYVSKMERRGDRYERFCDAHKNIKERVYRWKATDGLALKLTKEHTHLFRNNDFKWKKSVMGCALSHMGLWTYAQNK